MLSVSFLYEKTAEFVHILTLNVFTQGRVGGVSFKRYRVSATRIPAEVKGSRKLSKQRHLWKTEMVVMCEANKLSI